MSEDATFLCTLEDARREIKTEKAAPDEDMIVFEQIPALSERLMLMGQREFEPSYGTRVFRLGSTAFNGRIGTLNIRDDVFAVESITVGGTALDMDDVEIDPTALARGTTFRITARCRSIVASCGTDTGRVEITGWWGIGKGFHAVDTLKTSIDAEVDSLTVDDVDGLDYRGIAPRIAAGTLLRIDDELMRVVMTPNVETNAVPVLRGQRGTTAAEHAADAPVEVWAVFPDVRRAAARWVGLAYQKRAAYEQATITNVGVITAPADMPLEIKNVMETYRR